MDKWMTVCYPCPQVVPSTAPLVAVHPPEKKDLGTAGRGSQLSSDVSSLACLGTAVKTHSVMHFLRELVPGKTGKLVPMHFYGRPTRDFGGWRTESQTMPASC